ncbi:MAG: protein kinase [Candidatus Obscuribacterales bacterium]|nr:protein kinase [Candidatus Obscuribacterales bacterium]
MKEPLDKTNIKTAPAADKTDSIHLKVSDDDNGAEPSPDTAAQQSIANVDPEGIPQSTETSDPKVTKLLKSLPRLLLWQLIFLCLFMAPEFALVGGAIYWLFATHRTTSVAKRLFGSRNFSPATIIVMSIAPLLLMLSTPFIFRTFQDASLTLAVIMISYIAYQFKWPFSVARSIRKFELEKQNKKADSRGWLEAALVALSCNLFVPYLVLFHYVIKPLFESHSAYLQIEAVLFVGGMVGLQFLGLHYLNARIRKASKLKASSERTNKEIGGKQIEKVSDDYYAIRYRVFAQIERWLVHRFSQRSDKKLIFLLVITFAFFAAGAPQFMLEILPKLLGATAVGSVDAASQASSNLSFLNFFQWFLLFSSLSLGLAYLSKPNHLALGEKGIRFLWRHGPLKFESRYLCWQDINHISLIMPTGKTSPSDQLLVFHAKYGKDVKVKMGSITVVADKEKVLKAIERFAPGVHRDASVLSVLMPPADHSYTELWLQALSAPPKRERFKPLADGARLMDGRFKLAGQLGVGGQGTAYKAYDKEQGDDVVLKEFILPVYVDVSIRRHALERFENEARILKQLDHLQIVSLLDFFVEDHRSYLVLEHIDGKSLKQIVEESGPLKEEEVTGLARQMCTILDYLHGLSPPVVHRDFTPDNLILRQDGTLKLVDFNVAQQSEATATGTVVGKHAYLPPEQFRGTPVPQSDIYSLGATLHYLLTGEDPEPISTSHPQQTNEKVSEAMDFLVAKATATSLDDRYKDAAELQASIDTLLDG